MMWMRWPLAPALFLAIALGVLAAGCDSGGSDGDGTPPGDPFPAGKAQTCDGTEVDLLTLFAESDVTYMAFGALWCEPCKQEVPIINAEVVDHFQGKPVGAVQILLEGALNDVTATAQDCQAWVDELAPSYTILFDAGGSLAQQHFGGAIDTLPRHHLVTRDGTLVYEKSGSVPDNLADLIGDWVL